MSYYKMKSYNLKQDKERKNYFWRVCVADSSVRPLHYFTTSMGADENWTKEEAEEHMFRQVLDGNIHTSTGKYSYLDWEKGTIQLDNDQLQELKELDKKRWDLYKIYVNDKTLSEEDRNKVKKEMDRITDEYYKKHYDYNREKFNKKLDLLGIL